MTCSDFGEFVEKALTTIDGIEGDSRWTDQLVNDKLYNELRAQG